MWRRLFTMDTCLVDFCRCQLQADSWVDVRCNHWFINAFSLSVSYITLTQLYCLVLPIFLEVLKASYVVMPYFWLSSFHLLLSSFPSLACGLWCHWFCILDERIILAVITIFLVFGNVALEEMRLFGRNNSSSDR